jgi:hypothetical protein
MLKMPLLGPLGQPTCPFIPIYGAVESISLMLAPYTWIPYPHLVGRQVMKKSILIKNEK